MKLSFFICLALFSYYAGFCQNGGNGQIFKGKDRLKKEYKYYSVSGGISATSYFGDLNSPGINNFLHNRSTDVSISASIDRRIAKNVSISTGIAWVRITADEYYLANTGTGEGIKQYIRNFSFRNDIFEWNVNAKFFFKKNEYTYQERPFFNPYIFAGVGIAYHNPMARIPEFDVNNERLANAGNWTSLRPLGTEGQNSQYHNVKSYSYFQPIIPAGLGATFKINPYLDMSFEVSFRYTFTDYLDDVSGQYVDLGALDSDLARVLSYRSNEVNSANGRNPRNIELIYSHTQPVIYNSPYDGKNYQVLEGFGSEGDIRGDEQSSDFYVLTGIRITYILAGKKKN